MKKLFFFLSLLVISVAGVSQATGPFPNYQHQGSPTTRWTQQGAVQGMKGIINGVYSDTLTANNTSYIDFYPGAVIFTQKLPLDSGTIWLRNHNATKWLRQTGDISSFTFNTDSSATICYGNGVCIDIEINNFDSSIVNVVNNNFAQTFNYGDSGIIICTGTGAAMVCDTFLFAIDSINNFFFLNDSMAVACDTPQVITVGDSSFIQQLCDTIKIPRRNLFIFQNGVQQISPGIVEHGDLNNQPNPSQLQKNTYLYTDFYNYGITSAPYLRPVLSVQNKQWTSISQSIVSFNSLGNNIYFRPTQIDNENPVNLYLNYINPMTEGNGVFAGDTIGTMDDRIGYAWMTNAHSSKSGYDLNSTIAKQSGIMLHTLDTAYTDAVTIFANKTPNRYLFSVSPFPTTTLLDSRIVVFHTDKSSNFLGKLYLTNGRLEPDTALITAANNLTLGLGNVNIVSGATQINAIVTSGWQAGSSPVYLKFNGAPLVKNNTAGGAGTSTILLAGRVDFQAAAGDVLALMYDGTNWYETNRTLAATAGGLLFARTDAINNSGAAMYFDGNARSMTWDNNAAFQFSGTSFGYSDYATVQTRIGASPTVTELYSPNGNNALRVANSFSEWLVQNSNIQLSTSEAGETANFSLDEGAYSVSGVSSNLSSSIIHNDVSGSLVLSSNKTTTLDADLGTLMEGRLEEDKGADVVAAGNLTLGLGGNLFTVTGSAQINAITTANWQAGSTVGFIFTGAPLVKHNTAGGAGTATMLLAGSTDFQAAAGDNIEFRYDGTNWHEIGRTIAASGSVSILTADNGLTKNTATNVQLGATASGSANSPLLHTTYINTGSFRLYAYGESATLPPLTANNFSGGPAFHAVSTTGPAVYAQANSGVIVNATMTASNQNSSLEILRLNRETTGGGGVGQVGIGAYIDMLLHTSTTAGQLATRINTEYTVVTHGSQISKLTISGVNGGSTVEALVLGGEGYIKLRPITATAASAITPAEGMMLFTSDTNGTFTSVGFWGYQGGSWIKM